MVFLGKRATNISLSKTLGFKINCKTFSQFIWFLLSNPFCTILNYFTVSGTCKMTWKASPKYSLILTRCLLMGQLVFVVAHLVRMAQRLLTAFLIRDQIGKSCPIIIFLSLVSGYRKYSLTQVRYPLQKRQNWRRLSRSTEKSKVLWS